MLSRCKLLLFPQSHNLTLISAAFTCIGELMGVFGANVCLRPLDWWDPYVQLVLGHVMYGGNYPSVSEDIQVVDCECTPLIFPEHI